MTPPTDHLPNPLAGAAAIDALQRILFVSGQVPQLPNGSCPSEFSAQARQCWRNLAAVLASADMELNDLVQVQAYVTQAENAEAYHAVRAEMSKLDRPAHTLTVVPALGRPEWHVTIEAVAARP